MPPGVPRRPPGRRDTIFARTRWERSTTYKGRSRGFGTCRSGSPPSAAWKQRPWRLWKPYHLLFLTHALFFPAIIAVGLRFAGSLATHQANRTG